MIVEATAIAAVKLIYPDVFEDERGFFMETFHRRRYDEAGIRAAFVQDNLSFSRSGVLRGMHYQWPQPQAKLVQVVTGAVFDVAVDIRLGSPTFGRWVGLELSAENRRQLFIPAGFAHGFCVISETAVVSYKCDALYVPDTDRAIHWNDPDIAVTWPVQAPLLSPKDRDAPFLKDLPQSHLPVYASGGQDVAGK